MPTPFVLKLEYGAGLSDQDRQVLEHAVRDVRQFKPRHDLIREDDSPENVHVILEGFACRYKLLPDGPVQDHHPCSLVVHARRSGHPA
jgi:CRP-like cAMP-binding protein